MVKITVRELINKNVFSINENDKVRDLLLLFAEKQINGVPVINKDNVLTGIITDADILREIHHPPKLIDVMIYIAAFDTEKMLLEEINSLLERPVKELMTKKVVTVTEDTAISEVSKILTRRKFKKLPVVKDDKLVGIVSRGDVVSCLVRRFIV